VFWEKDLYYLKLRYTSKSTLPLLVLLTKASVMCALQETKNVIPFPPLVYLANTQEWYTWQIFSWSMPSCSQELRTWQLTNHSIDQFILMSAHLSLIWLSNVDKSWELTTSVNLTRKQTMAIPLACHIYQLFVENGQVANVSASASFPCSAKYPEWQLCVHIAVSWNPLKLVSVILCAYNHIAHWMTSASSAPIFRPPGNIHLH
jgi:hypothetical protein